LRFLIDDTGKLIPSSWNNFATTSSRDSVIVRNFGFWKLS